MRIETPGFITADFCMKGETPGKSDIMPSQVHGRNILVATAETLPEISLPSRPEADGILLTVPGVTASLRFADCAPVMLWGDSWVMILHSGYKGTVLNISREGLRIAGEIYGAETVREAHAWIGPCIGREYFRKSGDEWTVRGLEAFHRENYTADGENVYFDLAGEISCQLLDRGLRRENISVSGINTLTDSRCCSYRRGDIHERMTLSAKIQGSNH
ncbi:MAG: polyphenol oxidase family protein [Synergistaceae bacterium]|nr:polyphenol oxidase family protein [Synergistaceae bacterium]MBQ7169722.1 polyphenol oxidase family protein [Synergistaceae bacterium]